MRRGWGVGGAVPVEEAVAAGREGAGMDAHDEGGRGVDKLEELQRQDRHVDVLPLERVEQREQRLGDGGED